MIRDTMLAVMYSQYAMGEIEMNDDFIQKRLDLIQAEIDAINSRITMLTKRFEHHISLHHDAHTGGKKE